MQGKAAAWIGRYLAHLRTERRLSPHTEAAYRRDLEALTSYCDAERIAGWKQLATRAYPRTPR
jgi:integrase/recombinase XerC